MLAWERTERVIIAGLIVAVFAGIGVGAFRKGVASAAVQLKQFNPDEYRAGTVETAPDLRVNINQATADELVRLRGVGKVLADRIVEYRLQNGLFLSIAEIKNVKGVGNALFEKIKDNIATE